MSTLRSIFFSIFFLLIFANNLLAQIASDTEGCFPFQIQFTAPAGAVTFFWDFKDGASSTLQNPAHTFSSDGIYNVEFRETDGGAIIRTVEITIYPKPEPLIEALPLSGCVPHDLEFKDKTIPVNGITIIEQDWVFGDGASATGAEVTHNYQNSGTYTVSLALKTNLESCDVTKQTENLVSVSNPPAVSFVTNPNPPVDCEGPLTVIFTNTTPGAGLSFEWDFGNDSTSTEVQPPIQNYTGAGTYPVTLTATNSDGCTSTTTKIVNIGSPFADFSVADTVCLNDNVNFTNNSSSGTYSWQFGPGSVPPISNQENPTALFTQEGNQSIILTVTSADGRCSNDTTINIYVEQADASFVAFPSYSCSEPKMTVYVPSNMNAAIYDWEFSDGRRSDARRPIQNLFNPDTSTYSINGRWTDMTYLTITTNAGCKNTAVFQDTIHQPNALFVPDVKKGCAPLTVTFADSSLSNETLMTWNYIYGDGNSDSFNNKGPHQHTFTNPGEYDVVLIVTNEGGCMDTSYTVRIEVGEMVAPDFTADKNTLCPGEAVQLADASVNANIDEWHFETDNGRSFHCFQDPMVDWKFDTETGAMDVALTVGYNGCYSTLNKQDFITVNGPIAQIDYETDCEAPLAVQFRDSSDTATDIKWFFGDGDSSIVAQPKHTYGGTGAYTVTLRAENAASGCPASETSATVYIKEIKADFKLDTLLCLGQEYDLDASTSQDAVEKCWKGYDWYFTFQRPIETQEKLTKLQFGTPGEHTVTLVATDINGCKDTTDLDVKVFETTPNYTIDKSKICFPSDVTFTEASTADTTIVKWEWNFGDGSTFVGQNPPIHTYNNSTDNPIRTLLTIENAIGCTNARFVGINVYEPVSFISTSPSPPAICAGEDVQFTGADFTGGGSNLSFAWDLGAGQTDNGRTVTGTYNAEGKYNVRLTYTEIATGCGGVVDTVVDVQGIPIADFIHDQEGQGIICHPQNIRFTDQTISTAAYTSVWNFGNGQSAVGDAPAASFSKGTYEVRMVASTTGGCTDTLKKTITLVGPEGDFEIDKNAICNGSEITFTLKDTVDVSNYSWDFGDGIIVDNTNPITHEYLNQSRGQTIVKLVLKGQGDLCSFSAEQPISIIEVEADFGPDTLCFEAVPFQNLSTSATVYTWDFGDGGNSMEANPVYTYDNPGVYPIELIAVNSNLGCSDTVRKVLTLLSLPETEATGDLVCQGQDGELSITNPNPNSIYTWSPANLVDDVNSTNPTISPVTDVSFQVQELDENGCVGIAEIPITVINRIAASNWDTTVCTGTQVQIPIVKGDVYTFNWAPADGLSCTDCSFPMATIKNSIVYNLTVTDEFDCFTDNISFEINTQPEQLLVPNAFTPDDDGTNDEFKVVLENANDIKVNRFQVFDRWGQLVYETNNPSEGWDGTIKGKNAPSDVYVYMIEMVFGTCSTSFLSGDITLIR